MTYWHASKQIRHRESHCKTYHTPHHILSSRLEWKVGKHHTARRITRKYVKWPRICESGYCTTGIGSNNTCHILEAIAKKKRYYLS